MPSSQRHSLNTQLVRTRPDFSPYLGLSNLFPLQLPIFGRLIMSLVDSREITGLAS
jgi:hypothetical protein